MADFMPGDVPPVFVAVPSVETACRPAGPAIITDKRHAAADGSHKTKKVMIRSGKKSFPVGIEIPPVDSPLFAGTVQSGIALAKDNLAQLALGQNIPNINRIEMTDGILCFSGVCSHVRIVGGVHVLNQNIESHIHLIDRLVHRVQQGGRGDKGCSRDRIPRWWIGGSSDFSEVADRRGSFAGFKRRIIPPVRCIAFEDMVSQVAIGQQGGFDITVRLFFAPAAIGSDRPRINRKLGDAIGIQQNHFEIGTANVITIQIKGANLSIIGYGSPHKLGWIGWIDGESIHCKQHDH